MAGRPESYFREPDQHAWADRFGLPGADDGSFDYRAFTAGALRAGTTPNGVFAARIMWGTMNLLIDHLDPARRCRRDLDVLVDAFGPLQLVHLRRDDAVGQSVSWARAERTGYWHHGDATLPGEPRLDLGQIDLLANTIREHNAAWRSWFTAQDVDPLVVTDEDLVADPRHAVHRILRSVSVALPSGWRPSSLHRRQAEEVSADWAQRYRDAYGLSAPSVTPRRNSLWTDRPPIDRRRWRRAESVRVCFTLPPMGVFDRSLRARAKSDDWKVLTTSQTKSVGRPR